MAAILNDILGSVSYVGAVVAAAALVGGKLTRRRGYWARLLLGAAGLCALSYGLEALVWRLQIPAYGTIVLRSMNCVVVFLLTMGLMRVSCVCSFWQALYCVTTGYCMEHLSQKMYSIAVLFIDGELSAWTGFALTVLMRALLYVPMYLVLIKRVNLSHIETDNKTQTVVALIIVSSAIFMNGFSGLAATGGPKLLHLLLYLYSIMLCVLGLFVEMYQLLYQRVKSERDLLRSLIEQEAENYRKEKDAIEIINVKYHDLKHQLRVLEREYGPEKMRDMREAVDGYDSLFHTGNVALDTVLAMKNYACLSKGIQLTCLADGGCLGWMSETDIYAMFGNMLDNAIEAAEKLPPERRIISLNVSCRNRFVFIHCENYCDAEPVFIDGIPQTTKAEKRSHGFGTHSLRMLAENYGGVCTFGTNRSAFYTDLVLPQRA